MRNHIKVYAKDDIQMYFYRQIRIWKDMEHRIKDNMFENVEEKIRNRRRWLDSKKKILGKT